MTDNQTIAKTILAQLGGNRFIAMTGAKDFLSGDSRLQFSLPRAAKNKINKIVIILDATDTYTVRFYQFKRSTLELILVNEDSDVYVDNLRETFETRTGLLTRL